MTTEDNSSTCKSDEDASPDERFPFRTTNSASVVQFGIFGMVHDEVAEPRPSGSGIRYEIAKAPLPNGRGSATQRKTEMNLTEFLLHNRARFIGD